jgi:hypothetical protein
VWLLIEAPVTNQEGERSCRVCVQGIDFYGCEIDIGPVPTQRGIFFYLHFTADIVRIFVTGRTFMTSCRLVGSNCRQQRK